jgi:hypothetical protein
VKRVPAALDIVTGRHVPTESGYPFIKRAFEEVAAGWRVLAEQMEWIDRRNLL